MTPIKLNLGPNEVKKIHQKPHITPNSTKPISLNPTCTNETLTIYDKPTPAKVGATTHNDGTQIVDKEKQWGSALNPPRARGWRINRGGNRGLISSPVRVRDSGAGSDGGNAEMDARCAGIWNAERIRTGRASQTKPRNLLTKAWNPIYVFESAMNTYTVCYRRVRDTVYGMRSMSSWFLWAAWVLPAPRTPRCQKLSARQEVKGRTDGWSPEAGTSRHPNLTWGLFWCCDRWGIICHGLFGAHPNVFFAVAIGCERSWNHALESVKGLTLFMFLPMLLSWRSKEARAILRTSLGTIF